MRQDHISAHTANFDLRLPLNTQLAETRNKHPTQEGYVYVPDCCVYREVKIRVLFNILQELKMLSLNWD